MLFKDIIGQHDIKTRLIRSVKEGRISHAQLIIGPQGTGKLALALAYAQFISCENKQENDSCGECPSCHKFNKYIHPDLHFVFPVIKVKGKKEVSDTYIAEWREALNENPFLSLSDWTQHLGAENKQPIIYTEEADEIIRKLNFKSFEGEYKIMIIWLAEKMHQVCANKLLKIIEEPPEKTIFILIAEEPDLLLQTILSRTQLIKVQKIDDESLKNQLMVKFSLSEDDAMSIVKISNGSYNEALNNIKLSDESKFNFDAFTSYMRLSYGFKVPELQKWVDDIASVGRERQKSFLLYSLRMIRESYIQNLQMDNLNYMSKDEKIFTDKFCTYINEKNIDAISKEFNTASYHIERNGSARIIFVDLSLKLAKLLRQ